MNSKPKSLVKQTNVLPNGGKKSFDWKVYDGDMYDFGITMKQRAQAHKMWLNYLVYDDDRKMAAAEMTDGTYTVRFTCEQLRNEKRLQLIGVEMAASLAGLV